jgi:hypothetical protein
MVTIMAAAAAIATAMTATFSKSELLRPTIGPTPGVVVMGK